MSRKDVDNYFKEVCDDYREMIEAIHDLEKESNEGLVSPERLEEMKRNIEPIKANWMRISYIMYLLNRPNRKSKQKRYDDNSKMKNQGTLEEVHKENDMYLQKVRTSLH